MAEAAPGAQMENPFDADRYRDLPDVEIPLGAVDPVGGDELASEWLWNSAPTEINHLLHRFDVGLSVDRSQMQGGRRFRAVGVDLPLLRAKVNATLADERRRPMSRVNFAIGLSMLHDFDLSKGSDRGIYVGVRLQKLSPDGTVDQAMHKVIYESCLVRLRTTGQRHWRPRTSGEYWSIWRYCDTTATTSARAATELILSDYLHGLASLRGLCWA